MHAKQKSSDGEYSALQGETRLPQVIYKTLVYIIIIIYMYYKQIPLPASSDYLQINLKDMVNSRCKIVYRT